MTHNSSTEKSFSSGLRWRGLGGWNYYFLAKFALLWAGYLNFNPLENLVFMAFLLMPISFRWLSKLRDWIAFPLGFALFWHDTWLPGWDSIISQGSQVTEFSFNYLLELSGRFINWKMVGWAFVLLVIYRLINPWIRVSAFVIAIMLWLNISPLIGSIFVSDSSVAPAPQTAASPVTSENNALQSAAPTNDNLTAYLDKFYATEAQRKTIFPAVLPADAQPFDLLIINICSLSWSDIEHVGLSSHPLWKHFDILFKEFNSATSYSGPAAIRLLRASCGQTSHNNLYEPANGQCYLFDELARLGFSQQLMLDHDGKFGGFLDEVRQQGNIKIPLMDQSNLPVNLKAFDGSPIYSDGAVLNRWFDNLKNGKEAARSATFFNLVPLHDGNQYPNDSQPADYKVRAEKLFDELDAFLTKLEQSNRKVMVVIVPEHGAALEGDKMQVAGLRDIPSPRVTHVPAGIKFIGMKDPHQGMPIEINQPSSYLAISELVTRALDGKIFVADPVDWKALIQGLPETESVAENATSVTIKYQGKSYIRIGNRDWVAYPD